MNLSIARIFCSVCLKKENDNENEVICFQDLLLISPSHKLMNELNVVIFSNTSAMRETKCPVIRVAEKK